MSVSGHKCEQSIRSYAQTSTGVKRKISQTIWSASYGSAQNPTFDFALNFDDDADELPTQR